MQFQPQNPEYTLADMDNLAARWCRVAVWHTEGNKGTELYDETEKVANFLGRSLNQSPGDNKVNELCTVLIKMFGHLNEDQLKEFEQWINKNTVYSKNAPEKLEGAYLPLHHLFDAISKLKEKNSEQIDTRPIQNFELMLKKMAGNVQSDLFPLLPDKDLQKLTFNYMKDSELLALAKTPSKSQDLAKEALIDRINKNELYLRELGFLEIGTAIDFFGEDCSKITSLNLVSLPSVDDDDMKKISENFPNLSRLSFGYANVTDEGASHFPKTLTHLEISNCKQIHDFSFLENLPKLIELIIKGTNISDQTLANLRQKGVDVKN